ncbi:hypothetical protein GQ457_11G003810 [Hibiscus cannabinus]
MSQVGARGKFELDWEYLPESCLFIVLEKIHIPISQVQFGAVSRHWHSVFNTFLDYRRQINPVPLLLIPSKKSTTKRKLYSLQAKSKVSEIEFPKPYTWRCCGSCYGWLATVDDSLIITLSNPFEKVSSINLPRFDLLRIEYTPCQNQISKVFLSDDPLFHPDNYVVIIIYCVVNRLAIHKSGQKNWIYIDKDQDHFTDVIFHKSLVYAAGNLSHLVSFDLNGETSRPPKLKVFVRPNFSTNRSYLVKSSMENLYSIHRYRNLDYDLEDDEIDTPDTTDMFKVFKLVLDDESGELVEKRKVNHIDGDIVFLGDNQSLSVSALDFPQGQPNSIYFTDDIFELGYSLFGPQDIGIFHLKDKSFEKYYQFKSSHKDLPPYIWILPHGRLKSTLSN